MGGLRKIGDHGRQRLWRVLGGCASGAAWDGCAIRWWALAWWGAVRLAQLAVGVYEPRRDLAAALAKAGVASERFPALLAGETLRVPAPAEPVRMHLPEAVRMAAD